MTQESRAIEVLAETIGRNIYIDVARWHLYLAEAKLHVPLAEEFYTLAIAGPISSAEIEKVLTKILVPLGGGQRQLALKELIPGPVQNDLADLLAQFREEL